MDNVNFSIESEGKYSSLFRELEISTFHDACSYVHFLNYGRISERSDFSLVLLERKGTCSSKHALLAELALENKHPEIELICGIYLMSEETNNGVGKILSNYNLINIPECHVYIRVKGKRYDFTGERFSIEKIQPKIVREQRMDPSQASEWKVNIHKNYMESWLKRKPEINFTFGDLWNIREEIIASF